MQSKHYLKSKTLWLNVIATMLVQLEINIHFLRDTLGDKWYLTVIVVLAGANILMRKITKTPVHIKKGANDAH